jgi:hypothetical protein
MAPASQGISFELAKISFQNLKADSPYQMQIINPRDGAIIRNEKIKSDNAGVWVFTSTNIASPLPTMEDWLVSLQLLP